MRVLLVTPPMVQFNAPYAATPMLTAWLRSIGHDARQADLSLGLALRLSAMDRPGDAPPPEPGATSGGGAGAGRRAAGGTAVRSVPCAASRFAGAGPCAAPGESVSRRPGRRDPRRGRRAVRAGALRRTACGLRGVVRRPRGGPARPAVAGGPDVGRPGRELSSREPAAPAGGDDSVPRRGLRRAPHCPRRTADRSADS
jgi:hypothetical protein